MNGALAMTFSNRRQQIAELEQYLQERLAGRVRELRLSLSNGRWVLQGRAVAYTWKQLAQELVRQRGGEVASNDIAVDPPAALKAPPADD